jgi:glutaminyl-tRNA synthetase
LFIDEAPDSHKEKNFLDFINPDSLQIVTGFVEPSLIASKSGDQFQFQRLGYFSVDKESSSEKLVFNKTVGLKDAWEEKGKKEANLLMATQKEINKYVKEKDASNAAFILNTIIDNIKSIDNYSLMNQTIVKNVKNDNNALLFAHLILYYSDKVHAKDIESEPLTKLFGMSLKSQMPVVRSLALQNLNMDSNLAKDFKVQLEALKDTEKDTKVLELLNELHF